MATDSSPNTPSWRQRIQDCLARAQGHTSQRHRGLSWAFIIFGTLGAATAVWPFVTTVFDLLGLSTGQAWRLFGLAMCALLLAIGMAGANRVRSSPVRLLWLILAAWAVATCAVVIMTALAWLFMDTPRWQSPEELTPRALDAIATRAFAIVAGLGGVALLVIHYRRQRTTEADAVRAEAANARAERAAEREVAKLFTERFTTASEQLGSEHAAVRLAGIHALAHLADDAPEEREDLVQMVIDVLCAYLRMPYELTPNPLPKNTSKERREEYRKRELEFSAFREVRHTIIRIIGNHLRTVTRWRGKDYDFTGVVFDGGSLAGAVFEGRAFFNGARFSGGEVSFKEAIFSDGEISFEGAHFSGGGVSFEGANFSGSQVSFKGARFSGGRVSFGRAKFSGGHVSFTSDFSGSEVSFNSAHFSGGEVSFIAEFSDGEVDFSFTQFSGDVSFHFARFSGAKVSFFSSRFSGPKVNFSDTQFSSGEISFSGANFSGGNVAFYNVAFSGGCVTFRNARFSEGQVFFYSANFSGGRVFFESTVFSGGAVYFDGARFSGGEVFFVGALFSGGQVHFPGVRFTGGNVLFDRSHFSGGHVFFRPLEPGCRGPFGEASGVCPGGLLEAVGKGQSGVVFLPQAWQKDPVQASDNDGPWFS